MALKASRIRVDSHIVNLMYLDAGTGSLLLQALLGGVGGAMVFLRSRMHRWKKTKSPEPRLDES